METSAKTKFLPIGSTLDRYLVQGFLRIFFVSLLCITGLFAIVEIFDRIGTFLDTGASVWTVLRYFFYKLPLAISRVIGFATLFSTLFCLGLLARTQEITAMRSSGVSVQRISLPLFLLALLICLFTFLWNETLVPIFTHRAQTIYKTEVKNRKPRSLFGTRDIWIRGEGSFINVDYFDTKKTALEGITILKLDRDFTLKGFIDIPSARWTGKGWETQQATEWHVSPDGKLVNTKGAITPPISETPDDLKLLARDADEFTFFDLQKLIADMKSKGIDATVYQVDVQVKLALPFISPLVVLMATPFAIRRRGGGVALSFGTAMAIAFGYWVIAAFCVSLGHTGALPPLVAAWIPNSIFAMIGLFYYTAEE